VPDYPRLVSGQVKPLSTVRVPVLAATVPVLGAGT
jgi:hypothetical protein